MLRGRDVIMRHEGVEQRAGFYVNCSVEAVSEAKAGDEALSELRRNTKYLRLQAWPPGSSTMLPPVVVDSVRRFPWWKRFVPGITTGFVFYFENNNESSNENPS